MITAKLMVGGVHPFFAVLIGGIFVGVVLGAINGLLVNFTGLHPFIITLGTNAIFRGVTLIISGANPVFGFPYDFITALTGNIWFIPAPVVLAISVALILWFVTAKTRLGRNIYALWGNREAAYFSGIDVKLHTLIVFMISGVCSGLAGVLSAARLGAAEPAAGQGFKLLRSPRRSSAAPAFSGAKAEFLRW